MAAGQIREGGSHEREYKSKGNKKCKERCERGEREEIEGDQHRGQLGQGHGGQAQEAVVQSMSSFHLVCWRCSSLNFTQI